MKLPAPLSLAALSLTLAVSAQTASTPSQFDDPANLRGERIKPHDGRELPLDGGDGQAALGLQQLLRKLSTRASLMLIVAHPDDEDGGLLTLYSRGLGARVAMLTLNRGEGGQNAMTGDFEDTLGLLRTQELLAADRYLGVDQMFGTEVDYGFSKTKEEAFSKWTHQRVLYDAVRAVRLYRPLVIASVFIGGVTDGHGQHQVSGEIAQEVFKAAGDPKVFPELTAQGILPWQPLKVYARVPLGAVTAQGLFDYATGQYAPARFINYVTGEVTTTVPSTDVVAHEGQTDPLLTRAAANPADLAKSSGDRDAPLSYVQFARIGLGLQKSQIGPGARNAPAGTFDVAYHRYGSMLASPAQEETSFLDGIDVTLPSIGRLAPDSPAAWTAALEEIAASIAASSQAFDPQHIERTIPGLRNALRTLDTLLLNVKSSSVAASGKANVLHELLVKRVQLNDALLLAHRLDERPEAVRPAPLSLGYLLTTGTQLSVDLGVTNGGVTRIDFIGARLRLNQGTSAYRISTRASFNASSMAPGESTGIMVSSDLPDGLPATRPYFNRPSIEQPFYNLVVPELRNAPATPWPVTAEFTFADDRLPLYQSVVVTRPQAEPFAQPLTVVPPVSIAFAHNAQVLPRTETSFRATVLNQPTYLKGLQFSVKAPEGWQVDLQPDETPEFSAVPFHVVPPAGSKDATLHALAAAPHGTQFSEWYRPVGYGDLPRTNYFAPAAEHVVPVDLDLPQHRRIAYLPGTGDAVPESLASIGLPPTLLTVADLTPDKLASFDTVVLGVRTYNAHPDLHGAPTKALLDFARGGGNVVVQYQTAEFTGADAPYPLTLGRDAEKVVDETAPVRLLDRDAPLLASPNKLTENDFDGWIEERGHGFLRTWDTRYTAPTETHDPGSASEGVAPQEPQRGGLITVPLGKGHWTYCAFALYRQLPEAVPGAYRVFADLLSLGDER